MKYNQWRCGTYLLVGEECWASCITERHLKGETTRHKMAVKTRLMMRHLDVKVQSNMAAGNKNESLHLQKHLHQKHFHFKDIQIHLVQVVDQTRRRRRNAIISPFFFMVIHAAFFFPGKGLKTSFWTVFGIGSRCVLLEYVDLSLRKCVSSVLVSQGILVS